MQHILKTNQHTVFKDISLPSSDQIKVAMSTLSCL